MEPLPLLLTAVLLLLFNLIPYAQVRAGIALLAILLVVAAAIACWEARFLAVLVVCLGVLGFVLLLIPGSKRWAFPASCAVALVVHVGNAVTPSKREQLVAAEKETEPSLSHGGIALVAGWKAITEEKREQLRKDYPFQSVADRLPRKQAALGRLPDRSSSSTLEQAWSELEQWEGSLRDGLRPQALELVHSDSVKKFASRPGFGAYRMRNWPLPEDLPFKDEGPVARSRMFLDLNEDDYTPPGASTIVQPNFQSAHYQSLNEFLDPAALGYVRSRDQVAGFHPHEFRRLPFSTQEHQDRKRARWELLELRLVSLLLHETPVVYLSEKLPSMTKAKQLPTRPLDDFEKEALPALERGETLTASRNGDNLRVLGAIRAAKQCLKCHEVKRGDLLGAFTYTLHREK